MTPRRPELLPAGFFAIRAPALPFSVLEKWADGVESSDDPAAADRDRTLLRQRLATLLDRPDVRGAVYVASPDLDTASTGSMSDRAESALVRYLERMAARATPFGLFAGCGVGTIGDRTKLVLPTPSTWRRSTRPDADYVDALIRTLVESHELRDRILLRPNGSLHRIAGRPRYVESRLDKRERTYHLVELGDSKHLQRALDAAANGATVREVATAVAVDGVGIDPATKFVRDLVAAQVLLPELDVQVTGTLPLDALIADLENLAAAAAGTLSAVRTQLRSIDGSGFAATPADHRLVVDQLRQLPAEVEESRLFQVDLAIPNAGATLSNADAAEIARGVLLLQRISPPASRTDLGEFKTAFTTRYEGREVPLLDVLDEETGIGFGNTARDPSPLIDGLPIGRREPVDAPFGKRERRLQGLLERSLRTGNRELALTADDINALASDDPGEMPAAFSVQASLAETSSGRRILIDGVAGPSGARFVGRFCHADPCLEAAVRQHLRDEESVDPDAIFAEIVHLPSGRMANIMARPLLRHWEIDWLGRSGAPHDRRIPVSDLLVSLRGNRIVLRSATIGRRVIPRLTSAHNWDQRSPGVYRFLCGVQADGVRGGFAWSWGPLAQASYLPRLRHGRLVLARARWRFDETQLKTIRADPWPAMRKLRATLGLPRWIVLVDYDNRLPVDLDNVLSVDAFARVVRSRSEALLDELFPGPDELVAESPDGRHTHEIVVPFTRRDVAPKPLERDVVAPLSITTASTSARRVFAPGAPWVYLKLYSGSSTADRLLRDEIGPLAARLRADGGGADRWFFLRYADPEFHLRIRFCGDDPTPMREALEELAQTAIDRGLAHDALFGTYQREIERYGGPDAIDLAEQIFEADSDAVVELLPMFERGQAGLEERWRVGLLGTDVLMRDLGLDTTQRLEQARRIRNALADEHQPTPPAKRLIGERYRAARAELDELLDHQSSTLASAFTVLERRSVRIAPAVSELQALQSSGRLTLPIPELSVSFVHMWLNRLVRSANRTHEWVVYDMLTRLLETRTHRS